MSDHYYHGEWFLPVEPELIALPTGAIIGLTDKKTVERIYFEVIEHYCELAKNLIYLVVKIPANCAYLTEVNTQQFADYIEINWLKADMVESRYS